MILFFSIFSYLSKYLEKSFQTIFILLSLVILFLVSFFILKMKDKIFCKSKNLDDKIKNPQLPINNYEYSELAKIDNFNKNYYDEIKSIIENEQINNATIAIIGKWGTGKSSLLKMFQKKIKEEHEKSKKDKGKKSKIGLEIIYLDVISFNSYQQIYFNLVKLLGLRFGYRYWENILRNYELSIKGFKLYIDDSLNCDERLNHFKNHIAKKISKKKVIIILDELDRLIDAQAILNIFKFINGFCRIPNLYIIATIDRHAFLSLFKKEYLIAGYLDKTFDYKIEIFIPIEILRELFKEKMEKIIEEKKDLFIDEIYKDEQNLTKNLLNFILHSTSIFNFNSFRDVIMLIENVKKILNSSEKISKNIFLLDIILIEWLKFKHPLVWEALLDNYVLFFYKGDMDFQLLNRPDEKFEKFLLSSFVNNKREQMINDFLTNIKTLIGNNILDFESVINTICFLIDFYYDEDNNNEESLKVLECFNEQLKKDFKIECSSLLKDYMKGLIKNNSNDRQYVLHLIRILQFKRFFRYHNIKFYFGFSEILLDLGEKKFKNLNEIIESFKIDKNFEEIIKKYYINNIEKVENEGEVSIRNKLLEEVLFGIIGCTNENIYSIHAFIKEKIKEKNNGLNKDSYWNDILESWDKILETYKPEYYNSKKNNNNKSNTDSR